MGRLHFAVGPFVVLVGREMRDVGCFRDASQMWSDRVRVRGRPRHYHGAHRILIPPIEYL